MTPGSQMKRSAIEAGLRLALALALGLVMAVTIWVCLVAGFVVLLRPALGLGGALLSVGGALCAVVLLIVALRGPQAMSDPEPRSGVQDEAKALALRALFTPLGGRLALGAIGLALLALALLLPKPRNDPPE